MYHDPNLPGPFARHDSDCSPPRIGRPRMSSSRALRLQIRCFLGLPSLLGISYARSCWISIISSTYVLKPQSRYVSYTWSPKVFDPIKCLLSFRGLSPIGLRCTWPSKTTPCTSPMRVWPVFGGMDESDWRVAGWSWSRIFSQTLQTAERDLSKRQRKDTCQDPPGAHTVGA